MADDYEKYERECKRIRRENEKLLDGFADWLAAKGLSVATVDRHCENIEFYVNTFLLYDDTETAAEGVYSVRMFLGYWFIRKAMWASRASIKANAASLRKFYTFMVEKGKVDREDFNVLKRTIKNEMPEWLAALERYDDPDIDDLDEVWRF